MYKFICEFCKKEFFDKNHTRRYCSLECRNLAHRERPGYWTNKKRGSLSKSWRRKIGLANKGKKLSKEHIEKIKQRMFGTKMSLETRQKLKQSLKGRKAWNKGKKCPKISKAMSGKNNHRFGKMPWNKGIKYLQIIGSKNGNWKGGKTISVDGYILIRQYNHPFAIKRGYIKRSRLVVEAQIGRFLKPEEVVHHINGIKTDDRPENLMCFESNGFHKSFHRWKKCNSKHIVFDGRKLSSCNSS